MNLDEILLQLQAHGTWGWVLAVAIVALSALRKSRSPATPVSPPPSPTPAVQVASAGGGIEVSYAQALLEQHAALVTAAAAERKRLKTELGTLVSITGIAPLD